MGDMPPDIDINQNLQSFVSINGYKPYKINNYHNLIQSPLEELILLSWILTLYRYNNEWDFDLSWDIGIFHESTQQPKNLSIKFVITSEAFQEIILKSTNDEKLVEKLKQLATQQLSNTKIDSDTKYDDKTIILVNGNVRQSTSASVSLEIFNQNSLLWIKPSWDDKLMSEFGSLCYVESLIHIFNLLVEDQIQNQSQAQVQHENLDLRLIMQINPWENQQLWNLNKELPPMISTCMHDIITKSSYLDPEKEAIHSWDGSLTYEQVERYSNILARQLYQETNGSHQIIPICFPKSRLTVIAVLAVMKVGCAFVLMDPSQPSQRLSTIISDVSARYLITIESLSYFGQEIISNGQIITLSDSILQQYDDEKNVQPSFQLPHVDPSSILYIIFTSGSTGKPKGVVISHETYTSGAIPRANAVGYKDTTRVLDFASYAFDVSIDSMLCTLMQGGCLCIPSDDDRMNDLNAVIRSMKITMANVTPSVARILDQDVIDNLDSLGLGGESTSPSDVQNWGKSTRIVIGYGPSECTVGCTINNSAATGKGYVNIGLPTGACLWLTDPENSNQLVPIGAVGELLVEGPVVGQGYYNDPIKTNDVFIQSPTWLSRFGRSSTIYKTGDLVKYDPNGEGGLIFVGRKDTQVKIRGQRVELGEVEYHVKSQLGHDFEVIAEVVKKGKNNQLVAFVTEKFAPNQINNLSQSGVKMIKPTPELETVLKEIEHRLRSMVPHYMIPNSYIIINHMPLMVSRKVDRKQLRALLHSSDIDCSPINHKNNLSNKTIDKNKESKAFGNIWSQILGLSTQEITYQSNFFDLGGDSVLAMKLVSASKEQNIDIRVSDILTKPNFFEMLQSTSLFSKQAQDIDVIESFSLLDSDWSAFEAKVEASSKCQKEPSEILDIYSCTDLQETLMAFSVRSESPFISQRVFKVSSKGNLERFKKAWEIIYEENSVLRTRIVQFDAHGLMQVVIKQNLEWRYSYNLERYLQSDKKIPRLLNDDLCSLAIISGSDDDDYYVVWTVSHALYDGWSYYSILNRVSRLYRGLEVQKLTEYNVFINYLSFFDKDKSIDYWRDQFTSSIGLQFPQTPSRNYIPKANGRLKKEILIKNVAKTSLSIPNVIRAAWALLSSQYTGSKTVIIGETLTGRSIPINSVENIQGPLITTIPIRINVDTNLEVNDFLKIIQDESIKRMEHQHLGLHKIRKLSEEAQIACEIKTALIIQPLMENDQSLSDHGIILMNTKDPSEESIEFNSYPLLLSCSLNKSGFIIHVSFDKDLIETVQMNRLLIQFEDLIQKLIQSTNKKILDIDLTCEYDVEQIWKWNSAAAISQNIENGALTLGDQIQTGSLIEKFVTPWIVNPSNTNQLSPIGCIGELLVEGPFNSKSYVENPIWLTQGYDSKYGRRGKLHRTGDLVRYQSDGSIKVVKRVFNDSNSTKSDDHNVEELKKHIRIIIPGLKNILLHKVGSFTLALIEIEQNKENDPDTIPQMNVELGYETKLLTDELSKMILNSVGIDMMSKIIQLESYLKNNLPSACVPNAFIPIQNTQETLEEFNKRLLRVDEEDLKAYQKWLSTLKSNIEEKTYGQISDKEIILKEYWAQILSQDRKSISRDDGFFALGGDSIMAMKLASSLKLSGYKLTVANIFQSNTLHGMASMMTDLSDKDIESYMNKDLVNNTTTPNENIILKKQRSFEHVQKLSNIKALIKHSGHIANIIPVTFAQSFDIEGTVNEPRTSVQYNMLYFENDFDLKRMSRVAQELVQHHDILKTVFVKSENVYVQVVLSSLNVPEEWRRCYGDVKNYCQQVAKHDIGSSSFHLGSTFLKFFYVIGESQSAFMFRISHSQYDGVSLSRLIQQIGLLYGGDKLPQSIPIADFVDFSNGCRKMIDIQYWKTKLNASRVSTISPSHSPSVSKEAIFLSKTISIDKPKGITFATLLTTAWSLVLHKSLNSLDLVFGIISNRRNIDLDEAYMIDGPCYGHVPIRIQLKLGMKSYELLELVQNERGDVMPHEAIELDTIVKECTDWNDGIMFDSIIDHQDIEYFDELEFANTFAKVDYIIPAGESAKPLKVVSYLEKKQNENESKNTITYGIVGYKADEKFLLEKIEDLVKHVYLLAENNVVT